MTKGRGNKLVLRPDQVRRALARLKENVPLKHIARDMGMSDNVLARALRESGIEPNGFKFQWSEDAARVAAAKQRAR